MNSKSFYTVIFNKADQLFLQSINISPIGLIMDKEQVIEIVKEYKKAVLKQISNAKVYLYGSYSKGTARPESDIDVAIVVPAIQDDWLDVSTTLWLLAPQINYLIEPVLIDQRFPSPLYDDVLRTGIAIA